MRKPKKAKDDIAYKIYAPPKDFVRAYIALLLQVIGLVANDKHLEVVLYIVNNTDIKTKIFLGTQDKIAETCKCSRPVVNEIFVKLKKYNFIEQIQNGAYKVGRNLLLNGKDDYKRITIDLYKSEAEKEIRVEEGNKTSSKEDNKRLIEEAKREKEENIVDFINSIPDKESEKTDEAKTVLPDNN